MRRIAFAGAVVILVLAGFLAIPRSIDVPPQAQSTGETLGVHASPVPVPSHRRDAPPQPAPVVAARQSGSPSRALAAEFAAATDWRRFALAARGRPEEGGHFYAKHVAMVCGTRPPGGADRVGEAAAAHVQRTGTVSTAAMEMVAQWVARCAAFSQPEGAAILREIRAQEAQGRDPLLAANRRLFASFKGSDAQEQRSALADLLSTGDPLAIYGGGMLLLAMSRPSKFDTMTAIWFDGELHEGLKPHGTMGGFPLALSIAGCAGQAVCDIDDFMQSTCAVGSFCAASREEFWRHLHASDGGADEDFPKMVALARRIQQAVSQRRVDAFIP